MFEQNPEQLYSISFNLFTEITLTQFEGSWEYYRGKNTMSVPMG